MSSLKKKRSRTDLSESSSSKKKVVATQRKVVKAQRSKKFAEIPRTPDDQIERKRKTSTELKTQKYKKKQTSSTKRKNSAAAEFVASMPITFREHKKRSEEDDEIIQKMKLMYLG